MINSKPTPQKVLGYVDLKERVGYSNRDRHGDQLIVWSCYDLDSGKVICHSWTKFGCEDKYLRLKELMTKARNSEKYLEEVKRRKLNESI